MLMDKGLLVLSEAEYFDKVLETAYFYTDFGSGQREVKQAAAIAGYDDQED
jgi:hypothetical protein